MENKYKLLKEKLGEIADINSANNLLQWDQQTYMPKGGASARAESISVLSRIAHEKFTAQETGRLINESRSWAENKGFDSDEAALLRVVVRDYEKAVKIPADFVAELSKEVSVAMEAWQNAKAKSDFSLFKDHLKKIVELNKRKAEILGYKESLYDALLDEFEPDMTKAQVKKAFKELRDGLVSIVQKIAKKQDRISNSIFNQDIDEKKQFKFTRGIVEALGYDFNRGRQDLSSHPFSVDLSLNDVRITTRVQKNWFPGALYASIHECGHALYAQGVNQAYERTPLSGGASFGIHESQSRMWENIVARSMQFCGWILPKLTKEFPEQFGKVSVEQLYGAANKAGPSLVRVEADEVTYNLHILLRFEIETDLLEGRLKVEDVPVVWNEKMEKYLGIRPEKDADGVLQDIHWSLGSMGYFPTYTLGNIIAVQLFNKALSDIPGLYSTFERGEFKPLLAWLRDNIHVHGRKYTPNELLKRVLNDTLQVAPFLRYIEEKYSMIYGFEMKQREPMQKTAEIAK